MTVESVKKVALAQQGIRPGLVLITTDTLNAYIEANIKSRTTMLLKGVPILVLARNERNMVYFMYKKQLLWTRPEWLVASSMVLFTGS